jgi:hypothetical protein
MVQLDSVDVEERVLKVSSGHAVTPSKVTFNQLLQFNNDEHTSFQSRLVVIDSVEFVAGSKAQFFADAIGKYSVDHLIKNAFGQQVVLRTSGYANFADHLTPCGKGTMTVIVGQYKSDLQLTIRDFKEVKLNHENCPFLVSTFNDVNILKGGWSNSKVSGNIDWKSGSYNNRNYAQISNYINWSNTACETWLISPAMNISSSLNPHVSFESAYNYTGPSLQVMVSTNYTAGDPNAAAWVNLNPTLSVGSWNWMYSGDISLSGYKSTNTRIAFKYTGTNAAGSTWEIDDVAVFGE